MSSGFSHRNRVPRPRVFTAPASSYPQPGELDLKRHLVAQSSGHGSHAQALVELKKGQKKSHWMWYIFPQLTGVQASSMSIQYSIPSLDDAVVYLEHPVLGSRLLDSARALLAWPERGPDEIFGEIDEEKFHASITLFARVSEDPVFRQLLEQWYEGEDERFTAELLEASTE
jgi:uncharacterized protein (DUF1810 family)